MPYLITLNKANVQCCIHWNVTLLKSFNFSESVSKVKTERCSLTKDSCYSYTHLLCVSPFAILLPETKLSHSRGISEAYPGSESPGQPGDKNICYHLQTNLYQQRKNLDYADAQYY